MQDIYSILFSWAITLSGYPPADPPTIEFKPKAFFVKEACGGNENCRVVGWYRGGTTVYVWDRLNIDGSQIAASVVVHENVHYLQWMAQRPQRTCTEIIELEREAYGVQKEYLLRNGILANGVGLTVVSMHCDKE
jgi:hypothetical protein